MFGGFDGDIGMFEGDDTFEGRPILVRFSWSGVTTPTPRWEQAFSDDGGQSWETNWVMEFTPAGDARCAPLRLAGVRPDYRHLDEVDHAGAGRSTLGGRRP